MTELGLAEGMYLLLGNGWWVTIVVICLYRGARDLL